MFPSDFQFTSAHERILRETTITPEGPGTILRDFDTFVAYFEERPRRLTAGLQIAQANLPALNARLTHPIRLGLERPQQISYPHLHGLYLLLRASGMTRIDYTGRHPVLEIDSEPAADWRALNPTERYFTLLAVWLLRGWNEIIGEADARSLNFIIPENTASLVYFFRAAAQGGDDSPLPNLQRRPVLHNLGLAELFGWMTIEENPPVLGKGWQIERISCTPLGTAMLAAVANELKEYFFRHTEDFRQIGRLPLDHFRPFLQRFFPAWKNTLDQPAREYRPGLYSFRISWEKDSWWRLEIPAEATFDDLAETFLGAIRFTNDHFYRFIYLNRIGLRQHIDHPELEAGAPQTDKTTIGSVPLRIGQPMTFLFDFGDSWEFELKLERVSPPDPRRMRPRIVESRGRRPVQYR